MNEDEKKVTILSFKINLLLFSLIYLRRIFFEKITVTLDPTLECQFYFTRILFKQNNYL